MRICSAVSILGRVAGARAAAVAVITAFALLFGIYARAAVERSVTIDGSSTVYPITVAMAEAYAGVDKTFTASVSGNGSNAGLRLFLAGTIQIADSSRAMTPKEAQAAADKGLEVLELPIAFDGITLVTNPKNTFLTSLTVDELHRIWSVDSTVKTWSDVRKGWPNVPIALYGPGKDSGTFDYFANAITGGTGGHRLDYTPSEDDNVLVQGVVANEYALGYFGFAYFVENAAMLKAVAVDAGQGAIMPTPKNIHDGAYKPLSRPLFLYVDKAILSKPSVASFLDFYLKNQDIVREIGYVPLDASVQALVRSRFEQRVVGAPFASAPTSLGITQVLTGAAPAATGTQPAVAAVTATAATVAAAAHDGATTVATAASMTASTPTATVAPKPTPIPVAAAAPPAWQGPSAEAVRQSIEQLRDRSLVLARASLDDTTALAALDRDATALKELTATLVEQHRTAPGAATLTVAEALTLASADPAAYAALVDRLKLTDGGKTVVSDTAFAAFKADLATTQDAATRLSLARALARISPEQVPLFAEALSRMPENPAWRSLDLVRCYAKAGLSLQ